MAKNPERRFPHAGAARAELLKWTMGEQELPLDQPGDAGYQKSLAALENADLSPELMDDVILAEAADATPMPPPLPHATPSEDRNETMWIVLGLAGFWVFLLAVLGVILLVRSGSP